MLTLCVCYITPQPTPACAILTVILAEGPGHVVPQTLQRKWHDGTCLTLTFQVVWGMPCHMQSLPEEAKRHCAVRAGEGDNSFVDVSQRKVGNVLLACIVQSAYGLAPAAEHCMQCRCKITEGGSAVCRSMMTWKEPLHCMRLI